MHLWFSQLKSALDADSKRSHVQFNLCLARRADWGGIRAETVSVLSNWHYDADTSPPAAPGSLWWVTRQMSGFKWSTAFTAFVMCSQFLDVVRLLSSLIPAGWWMERMLAHIAGLGRYYNPLIHQWRYLHSLHSLFTFSFRSPCRWSMAAASITLVEGLWSDLAGCWQPDTASGEKNNTTR